MRRLFIVVALLALLSLGRPALAQDIPPDDDPAQVVLEALTPRERVGQLFLISFEGTDLAPESELVALLAENPVGGVVLSASDDNLDDRENLLSSTARLTRALQSVAAAPATSVANAGSLTPEAAQPDESPFVPLFIAVAHSGANPGQSAQFYSALSPLPSALAIGATWDPAQANAVGALLGRELSALGINMLLGPNLDVVDLPTPAGPSNLGIDSFGGNAYWVGRFAQDFVAGVHTGAEGQMLVVPRHFPGLGASDRAISADIPTINRPLEALLTVELAPFFAVTGEVTAPEQVADGLMLVPARYSGLQGTVTGDTRPLAFDQAAVNQLLGRPELSTWRANGGLLVSDSLGLGAVRQYYANASGTLPASTIALDAFLAGNDLLYIDDFAANASTTQAETLAIVIDQFVQKYNEDSLFAERVDRAAYRVLTSKLRIYGEFTLDNVVVDTVLAEAIGQGTPLTLSVAQQSATLIYPSAAELAVRVPRPPGINDRIVVLTDTRTRQQCSECLPGALPDPLAFQQALQRLYGDAGTQQIRNEAITSFTFGQVEDFLNGVEPTPEPVEITPDATAAATPETPASIADELAAADWVVVLMQDVTVAEPAAFLRLLNERPDLLEERQLVVFALNAPYFLDSTEVVQLSAYYALYAPGRPFVETAARLLFQEVNASAAPPVSVLATGYNLAQRLQPDPDQRIRLFVEVDVFEPDLTPTGPAPTAAGTQVAPEEVATGQTITLLTGVIHDLNGHPVPDGTLVQFSATYASPQGLTEVLGVLPTTNGVAVLNFNPSVAGFQTIAVSSGSAVNSDVVQLVVEEESVTVIPTEAPTETPLPPTPTATELPPTPTATPEPEPQPAEPEPPVGWGDFIWALIAVIVLGFMGWRMGEGSQPVSSRVKLTLVVVISVMVAYNYWALQGPGVALLAPFGPIVPVVFTWSAGLLGLLIGWWWLHRPAK